MKNKHKKSKNKLLREINYAIYQTAPFYMAEVALNDWLEPYGIRIWQGGNSFFVMGSIDHKANSEYEELFENVAYTAAMNFALNLAKERIIHNAVNVSETSKFPKKKKKTVNLI